MKTRFFLTALIVLVGTVTFAQETAGPRVAVVSQKTPSTFKVIYEGSKVGNVKMIIRNGADQIVFAETTKNVDGFIRRVNFTGMEFGEYTIEVADQSGKQKSKVVYEDRKSIKSIHVAKVDEEGKYLLSVSNRGEETINVSIFDGAYNLVHNQKMTINGDFGMVYDLKSIQGVPTFEVTDAAGRVQKIKR